MGEIQAIETRYKGYRFRSRLEARWAVFFDDLNIPWEYEKEGYVLPDGTKYLPDFWLPNQRFWFEVKGPEATAGELEKCRQLRDGTGRPVFLVTGNPPDHGIRLFCWDVSDSGGGSSEWDVPRFVWAPSCPLIPCIATHRHNLCVNPAMSDPLPYIESDATGATTLHELEVELMLPERTFVDRAYQAARSARFEHGESGAM